MLYKFEWVEKKRPDWIVATLVEGIENGQTFADVSINRTNKDGSLAFPKFDEFMPGGTVEGNLWRSPTTQKLSLFAPRPAPKNDGEVTARQTAPSYVPRGGGFAAGAMQTKAANIEKAQERKEAGIKLSSAFRDATMLLVNDPSYADMTIEERMAAHQNWVKWYMRQWDKAQEEYEQPF